MYVDSLTIQAGCQLRSNVVCLIGLLAMNVSVCEIKKRELDGDFLWPLFVPTVSVFFVKFSAVCGSFGIFLCDLVVFRYPLCPYCKGLVLGRYQF